MSVVAIGDPFCGWFRAVFCYMWGSGTLQFPHIFLTKSRFGRVRTLIILVHSARSRTLYFLYIERVRISIFLHTLKMIKGP